MKIVKSFSSLVLLLLVLLLSLLVVLTNPSVVVFDFFGIAEIQLNLGLLVLFAFICGFLLSLLALLFPFLWSGLHTKRLEKRLSKQSGMKK